MSKRVRIGRKRFPRKKPGTAARKYGDRPSARYTTQGTNELVNVQPFAVNYPFGLAMVHNGNVINFKELRKTLYEDHHRLVETSMIWNYYSTHW